MLSKILHFVSKMTCGSVYFFVILLPPMVVRFGPIPQSVI